MTTSSPNPHSVPASESPSLATHADAIAAARAAHRSIGLVQGSWDMFHLGHLCYLQKARKACDFLIVAMDDDEKIRHRKGGNRPIIPLEERYQMIDRLKIADALVVKHRGEPHWSLIKSLRPDVLVAIRENYSDDEVAELEQFCGEVRIFPREATTSTSEIIRRTLIANGVKALANQDPRVQDAVEALRARLGRWQALPAPWPDLLTYAERSTDWATPTAACCLRPDLPDNPASEEAPAGCIPAPSQWLFGANKIDQSIPRSDIESRSELLYSTVEHAEINLLKKLGGQPLSDGVLYTILFPCDRCLKTLASKGLKTVYYLEDHPERNWSRRSHARAQQAGIRTIQVSVDSSGQVHERLDAGPAADSKASPESNTAAAGSQPAASASADESLTPAESDRRYGQFRYFDPRNARHQEQIDLMLGFEREGKDSVAMENIDTSVQDIIIKGKYWYVIQNRFPYEGIEHQFVIFNRGEVYHIDQVTAPMWAELQSILAQLRERFNLAGGAFCMRFGDTARSAASLKRVHAHVITPKAGASTKFKIGQDRLGLKPGLHL